jgi:hypothetical protein
VLESVEQGYRGLHRSLSERAAQYIDTITSEAARYDAQLHATLAVRRWDPALDSARPTPDAAPSPAPSASAAAGRKSVTPAPVATPPPPAVAEEAAADEARELSADEREARVLDLLIEPADDHPAFRAAPSHKFAVVAHARTIPATVEAPAAAADAFEAEAFDPPLMPDGSAWIEAIRVPDDLTLLAKVSMRRACLLHAIGTNDIDITETTAESTALVSRETEVLEARLRAHRRRPGDLELDVYEVRERELKSHASRVERHILSIAQRAHGQQEAFVRAMAEGETFLRAALSATDQRTLALAKASNRATLNNLSRLARVGHATYCAEAKGRVEMLKKMATDSAEVLRVQNQRFVESLPSFEQGGQWNTEELAQVVLGCRKNDITIGQLSDWLHSWRSG